MLRFGIALASLVALPGLLALAAPASAQSGIWGDIARLREHSESLERQYESVLERVQSRAAERSSPGSLTSQRLGGFTFHSGSVGDEPVSGTTQSVGSFEFTDLRVGERPYSATSQEIGGFRFTDWSSGRSSTTQRLGPFEYTTTSTGETYTTQKIGSFRYTTGSDGSSAVTQEIGSFEYTTVTPPRW